MTDDLITPQQRELDQEQAVADLDQSIAYREQALSDREQERLDARQTLVDIERAETPVDQFAAHLALEHRQAELTRTQDRRDAYQDQIDDTQGGHDRLQDTLELGQDALELPTLCARTDDRGHRRGGTPAPTVGRRAGTGRGRPRGCRDAARRGGAAPHPLRTPGVIGRESGCDATKLESLPPLRPLPKEQLPWR